MALRSVHILIPRTCGYVKFHNRRDFVDVRKVMDLKTEIRLTDPGRPN